MDLKTNILFILYDLRLKSPTDYRESTVIVSRVSDLKD